MASKKTEKKQKVYFKEYKECKVFATTLAVMIILFYILNGFIPEWLQESEGDPIVFISGIIAMIFVFWVIHTLIFYPYYFIKKGLKKMAPDAKRGLVKKGANNYKKKYNGREKTNKTS